MTIAEPLDVPLPDDTARSEAASRLASLDLPGAGFGAVAEAVCWAAAVQGTADPQPFSAVRVVLLAGDHGGGVAAGTDPATSTRRAAQELAGEGQLARLAVRIGASVEVVDAALAGSPLAPDSTTRIRDGAAPIEETDAATEDETAAGFALGRKLADTLADSGVDLVVLASLGAGAEAAAAAAASFFTGVEPAALLAPVVGPDGRVEDTAWMRRCAAVRDALARVRTRKRDPQTALAALAGPDLAVATGLLLGAAARRTPVVLDGPVGTTAALLGRDIAGQLPHWCLAPDTARHPTTRTVAGRIGLDPFVDLRLDLGEGASALTALTVLQSALDLAHNTATIPQDATPENTASEDTGPGDTPPENTSSDDGPAADSDTGT